MKHDKGLLKADKLAAFREWLVAAGFEVRDGKGEFEVLQVKTGPSLWAVINRNGPGTLVTHPELRPLINRFNSGAQTSEPKKVAHVAGFAEAKAAHKSFLEDLRDDMAMAAMQGMLAADHKIKTADFAKAAYMMADAMLEARKSRSAPAPARAPRKSDEWSSDWKANGFNGCMVQASKALRYLASNDRPNGGEASFNFEHLIQLADELELTKAELLAP